MYTSSGSSTYSAGKVLFSKDTSTATECGPAQTRVTALFSAQVSSRPGAIAVEHNGQFTTYGDLDSRAEQLAKYLRALGVGPDVVVGLYVARSTAMIVGALAILKAGGAYLPLDPESPTARIGFQLQDAQVPVLISAECLTDRLPSGNWRKVRVDPDGRTRHIVDAAADSIAPLSISAEESAYVIYTSGSTGQPKGVEITHGGLENLVSWHQQAFAVTPSDRASLQASPGFDAAVWELWPYLTAGASIVVADDSVRNEPVRFRDWMVEKRITIAFAPTPIAESLIKLDWPRNTALRILLTGADTLKHRPPENLPFRLVNNYGPTECAVVSTSGTVSPGEANDLPSIGRPITNAQIYILNEAREPVRSGEAGELYIGGPGVARGYRNRPDLTAERFIPNPYGNSGRLYKTGDIASLLADGQVSFIGRNDDQVKIRGYRVELEEIAAVIDRHSAVQSSVVVARENETAGKHLVAFVAFRENQRLTEKQLRDYLLSTMPEYMVPAAFYRVDALPLTASGKVDRRALVSNASAELLRSGDCVAPQTPIEQSVAALLSDLMQLDNVGATDNFFVMGGNSLLGAQVIARVRDTFGVDLSLLSLFDHPTISELSAVIEKLLIEKLQDMSEEETERMLDRHQDAAA